MPALLRLDPAHPPLWRTERTLQFGVGAVAVLEDPAPWQQHLVHALADGLPDDAVATLAHEHSVDPDDARGLIDRIAPALHGPAGAAMRVVVEAPAADPLGAAVTVALRAAGVDVDQVDGGDRVVAADERGLLRVLVGHHVLDPRRAAAAMHDDAPHLPVVFTGAGARVGPLVLPGLTACVACDHAQRRDADPSWPVLLAQLLGRGPAELPAAVAYEAGCLAAHLIRDPGLPAVSVTLRRDSARRQWTHHRPHPECCCRAPQGNATAPAGCEPPRATTTATASATPA